MTYLPDGFVTDPQYWPRTSQYSILCCVVSNERDADWTTRDALVHRYDNVFYCRRKKRNHTKQRTLIILRNNGVMAPLVVSYQKLTFSDRSFGTFGSIVNKAFAEAISEYINVPHEEDTIEMLNLIDQLWRADRVIETRRAFKMIGKSYVNNVLRDHGYEFKD